MNDYCVDEATGVSTVSAFGVSAFLGFLGITDVEFVYAEGLNMGEEAKATALEAGITQLEKIAS